EDIRHQRGMKERYQQRKETIERLFGTAKEYHNLRYTRLRGKSKMEATLGLTLACLNMKKYSKIMAGIVFLVCLKVIISRPIVITIVKEKTSWINIPVCLQSEKLSIAQFLFYTLFLYSITDAFSNYIGHIILKSIWNDVSCA
ncbi:transposase, partial [Streptococcus agalactiae]